MGWGCLTGRDAGGVDHARDIAEGDHFAVDLYGTAVVLDEFGSEVGRSRPTSPAGLIPRESTSGPDSCGDVGPTGVGTSSKNLIGDTTR